MKCKIYLSDEGFGHIVRQRAVAEELHRLEPALQMLVQTSVHLETAKKFISNASFRDKFNNIVWYKKPNGSPDVEKIRASYKDYEHRSKLFIDEEIAETRADFLVSDFVYEAFEIGSQLKIPTFGIAHFTWDWFFSKLYPPAMESALLHRFIRQAEMATRLYFPPFTPEEILEHYGNKALHVPLIVKKEIDHKITGRINKFKILIMDSGAGVLAESIGKALSKIEVLDDMMFYVSSKYSGEASNITKIPAEDLMIDYIADMDLVIGRAGFNTISECIGLRTPMLLLGEAMNPEMSENILMLKKHHLGSFVSIDTFERSLSTFLPSFLKHEYPFIADMMKRHEIQTNGAEVIARDMLNHL